MHSPRLHLPPPANARHTSCHTRLQARDGLRQQRHGWAHEHLCRVAQQREEQRQRQQHQRGQKRQLRRRARWQRVAVVQLCIGDATVCAAAAHEGGSPTRAQVCGVGDGCLLARLNTRSNKRLNKRTFDGADAGSLSGGEP
eukprot:364930-Chlamydomonas_euryale.AAC.1